MNDRTVSEFPLSGPSPKTVLQAPQIPYAPKLEKQKMNFSLSDEQQTIEDAIGAICDKFDDNFWLKADNEKKFPHEFVDALVQTGWMGATIPED